MGRSPIARITKSIPKIKTAKIIFMNTLSSMSQQSGAKQARNQWSELRGSLVLSGDFRLVKEMRLAGIDTLEAANRFLELRFISEWEQRFTVAPRQPRNAHRRLGPEHRLEEILSVRAARKVAQDHTVSWEGNRWGYATGRRPRRSSGSARGDRAAPGWLALVAISRPLSPSATRPRTVAAHRVSKPQKRVSPNHPWRTFQYGRKPDISTLR
jgi:hypothetical protein